MGNEERQTNELKRVYLWAVRHHNMRAARAAIHRLHAIRNGYCAWEHHAEPTLKAL